MTTALCRQLSLEDPADRLLIEKQLQRILDSTHFRNSKRYPRMLRYVVEQTLAGKADGLKERSLGIAVFGRAPDYDSNADPVVRITAAEIRKRIAQYYDEGEHRDELRLDLPVGSYVPGFYAAERPPREEVVEPLECSTVAPAVPVAPRPIGNGILGRVRSAPKKRIAVPVFAGFVLLGVSAAAFLPRHNALETFWAPLVNDPNPVLICAGRNGVPRNDEGQTARKGGGIAWSDVMTLTRVVAFFSDHKHPYDLRREDQASFGDLRKGPTVLIGAFNDAWTLRLTKGSRYDFEIDDKGRWIVDRQQGGEHRWGIGPNGLPLHEDFAIVSRVHDPITGNILVTAGGLAGFGTAAAGEFLTSEKAMEKVLATAKDGGRSQNLQVVLHTVVINGNSGPPQVIATYFW